MAIVMNFIKIKDILYFNLYKAIESIYVIKYEPENKCQHL